MSNQMPSDFSKFDLNLPLNDLLEKYQKDKIYIDKLNDTNREDVWKQFSQAVCDHIWKLMFDTEDSPTKEKMTKASGLLTQLKEDSIIINYSIYNEWIYKFKKELLKRKLTEFFDQEIVAKLLGPCWSWSTEPPPVFITYSADRRKLYADFSEFDDPSLSEWELLDLFENAFYRKLDPDDRETFRDVWRQFSQAVCGCVWKILFDSENPPGKEQMDKASALLMKYKRDGTFINSTFYNYWIYEFRDELLKKELLEFWRNEVVAKELGPCWARDSDFYDDFKDPEPAEFYNHAGCKAVWLDKWETKPKTLPKYLEEPIPETFKTITMENAFEDFMVNLEIQRRIDYDDIEAYKRIFKEAQMVFWQLLFDGTSLTSERSKMAVDLLKAYREKACRCTPHVYNDWIIKVRDELCKRKHMDFWQIIDKERLGLCWRKDNVSSFKCPEDTKHVEFYKTGKELMNFYAVQ